MQSPVLNLTCGRDRVDGPVRGSGKLRSHRGKRVGFRRMRREASGRSRLWELGRSHVVSLRERLVIVRGPMRYYEAEEERKVSRRPCAAEHGRLVDHLDLPGVLTQDPREPIFGRTALAFQPGFLPKDRMRTAKPRAWRKAARADSTFLLFYFPSCACLQNSRNIKESSSFCRDAFITR